MAVTELEVQTYNHSDVPLISSLENQTGKNMAGQSELFVSSPYSGEEHHLDLSSVDERSRELAVALHGFHPTTNNYPSDPYATSFNWQEIVDRLPTDFEGSYFSPSLGDEILTTGNREILLHCILFYPQS